VVVAGTPAHGEDVARVVAAPVIERAAPAVKLHVDLVAVHCCHGGRADELRVLAVHRLQLQAHRELVVLGRRRLLGAEGERGGVVMVCDDGTQRESYSVRGIGESWRIRAD
jgi:hypothetical protein